MTEQPLFDATYYTLPPTPCANQRHHNAHSFIEMPSPFQTGLAPYHRWCPGIQTCHHECRFCGLKL